MIWPFGKNRNKDQDNSNESEPENEQVESKNPTFIDQILFSFKSLPDQWKCLANDCWLHSASDIYISLVGTKSTTGSGVTRSHPPMLYRWIDRNGKEELQEIYVLSKNEVQEFRAAFLEVEAAKFLEAAFLIDPKPEDKE